MARCQGRCGERFAAFSLLEVVIAAFLFATVFGALVAMWVYYDRALSLSKQRVVANMVAEQTMARCLASGFYLVDELAEAGPRTVAVLQEVDGEVQKGLYRASVEVELQPEEDLKLITVRVEYTDRGVAKHLERCHVVYWQN